MPNTHTSHAPVSVAVAVLDSSGWRLAPEVSEDIALTLLAVAGDDPSNWSDMLLLWPRHAMPAVPATAEELSLRTCSSEVIRRILGETECWVVLDLVHKRLLTGKRFEPFPRNEFLDMREDPGSGQQCPMGIYLPPWWEIVEQTELSAIDVRRATSGLAPSCNRQVLFGEPLHSDLAARILTIVHSPRWRSSDAVTNIRTRYALTVEVHRAWLMTARDDLRGQTPRDHLHGAIAWIDRLTDAQEQRALHGWPLVAVFDGVTTLEKSPMGSEEVAIYFDLCRHLINAGWNWTVESASGLGATLPPDPQVQHRLLRDHLREVQERWLDEPLEDDGPPRFILKCSRRRVPRCVNMEIVGMPERQGNEHGANCDCSWCGMLSSGAFGLSTLSLDGHHLELDNDFAFSLCDTEEEWREQLLELEELVE
ncbi:MAG: hypothetical protein KDA45_09615 [Planctomycetales bacterium]|nr:hypothetical protein [Planctomycetales bacterium]